jgi:predicted glycosyltransferase involved in capsule biosynthesis
MPKCSICCEKRKNVYQLCKTCTKDPAKRSCLKCHANMLFICPVKSDCIALHKKCAYCQTPMQQKDLKASALMTSVHYLEKANELWFKRLEDIINDRWNLLDVIEAQNKLITFFNKIYLRNPPVSSNLYHYNAISNHVNALLIERGRAAAPASATGLGESLN